MALLVPYFGWAIFLLRRRFKFYEENSLGLELLTAAWLVVFLWIWIAVLRMSLGDQMLQYLAALLALFMATFALYAHVMISLVSRLLVDFMSPRGDSAAYEPRFGPVDELERNEDYEGALQEYLVLARIYPRNFEVLSRTARVEAILGHHEEAVTWYLRARKRASRADEALAATNQLCTLYDAHLERPEEADQVLRQFLADYPDSPDRDLVKDRLERRAHRESFTHSAELATLEENPLADHEHGPVRETPRATPVELVNLDVAGVVDRPTENKPPEVAVAAVPRQAIALDPLESHHDFADTTGELPANGNRPPRKARATSTLQPLDAAAPLSEEPAPAESGNRPRTSPLGLEAMDS